MFSPVHCGEGRVSRVSKIRGQCLGHIMDKSLPGPRHCLRILETLDTLAKLPPVWQTSRQVVENFTMNKCGNRLNRHEV